MYFWTISARNKTGKVIIDAAAQRGPQAID
jgi:hypothetical protein